MKAVAETLVASSMSDIALPGMPMYPWTKSRRTLLYMAWSMRAAQSIVAVLSNCNSGDHNLIGRWVCKARMRAMSEDLDWECAQQLTRRLQLDEVVKVFQIQNDDDSPNLDRIHILYIPHIHKHTMSSACCTHNAISSIHTHLLYRYTDQNKGDVCNNVHIDISITSTTS